MQEQGSIVQRNPTSLPPSGAAGGSLGGTYPNPTLVPQGFTWATFPSAASNSGRVIALTDTIFAGSIWRSNGTVWLPQAPLVKTSGAALNSTNTTSPETLLTLVIPGGMMGPNGCLDLDIQWTCNNSAGTKSQRVKLGATSFLDTFFTTTQGIYTKTTICNRNANNSQVTRGAATATFYGSTNTAPTTGSIDTASDQNLVLESQKTVGTDTHRIERYVIQLFKVD